MSIHNVQFHNKIRKLPKIFVLWSYRKNKFKSALVNETSGFELSMFDCILLAIHKSCAVVSCQYLILIGALGKLGYMTVAFPG